MKRKILLNLLVYFVLATGISWIFRTILADYPSFLKLPYGTYNGMNLLVGSGPLISAILCKRLFPYKGSFLSFWGVSRLKSVLFLLIPILTVIFVGVINKKSIDVHLYSFHVCFMWLLYVAGEEFGWRGYLQGIVFKKGNDYIKAVFIGIIWYLWHISFLFEKYSFSKELFFILVLIVGSFIALKVTAKTKSLATAIALHFSFSVLTNIRLPEYSFFPILIMCGLWILLYVYWDKGLLKNL